tara:strand:- start:2722 stop:5613 length:2892 start_codon:yes stop_codon:yes gene_type:complete
MAITISPRVTAATVLSTGTLEVTGTSQLHLDPSSSGQDAKTTFSLQSSDKFVMGIDESTTNDDFVLSRGAALGTNNVISVDGSSGVLTANITGALTGNASGSAATVTGAAQSAITSVGTLTTLTVDSIIINGTNIGHTSDTDAIAIASSGVVTMNQIPVFSAGINVSGGSIAGTLSTAAQANITSVGTLTGLTVSGTVDLSANTLDNVGNANSSWTDGTLTVENNGFAAGIIRGYSTTAGTSSYLTLSRSNHGTLGTHGAVDADDVLGNINFTGSDGDSFENGARISAIPTETFSGSARGTKLVFSTVDNTTTTLDERMTISHGGNIGIGEAAPANLLHVKVSDTGIAPHGSAQLVLERDGTNYLQFLTGNDGTSGLLFGDEDDIDVAKIYYDHNVPAMYFATEANIGMTLAGGASPVLKLFGTASTGSDAGIVFDGEAQDYYIALDDGGDALFIGTDSTVGSNGAIIIDKKGGVSSDAIHVGINATPNINDLVTIGGAFAGYSNTHGLRIEPSLTAKAGNNAAVVSVAGTLVEAGSGTHANLWGSVFSAPTVTGGSAAVTNTATVYVANAMSAGTNNYGLWVDAGISRFDGDIQIGEGASSDTKIIFDGAADDWYMGYDHTNGAFSNFAIGYGSTVGTTPYIRLVGSGDFAYGMILGGTTTSSGAGTDATGVVFFPHITSHSGDSASVSLVRIGGQLAGQSMTLAGDTAIATSLHLSEPSITTGGNTITNSATLYIAGAATEATNDYAMWVDDGISKFDGYVYIDNYLQMSTANAGAANKIHVNNSHEDAGSEATVEVYVNGRNDSDTGILFATTYSTNVYWKVGIDQSNSKGFAISNNGSLGTDDALRMSSTNQETTLTLALGSVFDYVCNSCGRHEAERFECCGKVEWHDDVLALREMTLNRKGIEHMAKLGVMDISTNNDGSEWLGLNMQKSTQYTWSAMYQLYERIDRLEKELQELRS